MQGSDVMHTILLTLHNGEKKNNVLKWSVCGTIYYKTQTPSMLQSMQVLEEERLKLDSFCEQSLKNVSNVLLWFWNSLA